MTYFWLIIGIVCCIVGIVIHPMAKKWIQNDEINHLTLKGYILFYLLLIIGIIVKTLYGSPYNLTDQRLSEKWPV